MGVNLSNFRRSLLLPGGYLVIMGTLLWLFSGKSAFREAGDISTIDVSLLQKLLTAAVAAMYLVYARFSRFPWSFAFCLAFASSLGVQLVLPFMSVRSNLLLNYAVFSTALLPGLLLAKAGMKSTPRLLMFAGMAIIGGQATGIIPVYFPNSRKILTNSHALYITAATAGIAVQTWATYRLLLRDRRNATMLQVSSVCYLLFLSLYTIGSIYLPLQFLPPDSPEVIKVLSLVMLPTALLGDFFRTTRFGSAQITDSPDPAYRDALTGLPNRRALDLDGTKIFRQALSARKPVSVLMLDIDHFKQVNDIYGHQAGDVVLEIFGKLIADQVRSTDFVARFGGEEFIAVLPGAPLAPAIRLAERMRAIVQETVITYGPHQLKITASIGAATTFPGDKVDFKTLIDRADKNLYRAKRSGRNRVTAADVPELKY